MKQKIFQRVKEEIPGLQENVSLKEHTTFKIGGPARFFYEAKAKKDLVEVIKKVRELNLPLFLLGNGSNLLVSDKGYSGIVIKVSNSKLQTLGSKIIAGSGTPLEKLIKVSVKQGLKGLEWATGIPGTVGGAIWGNAGAFGKSTFDSLEKVEIFDMEELKIKNIFTNGSEYRNTIFKKKRDWVILSGVFKLNKGDRNKIEQRIECNLEYRRNSHPQKPSAGSVFKNCKTEIKNPSLLEKFPELKEFNSKGVIPAGYLIDKCGLKGEKRGSAQVSLKHANFIVNLNGASAREVLDLMKLAQKKVSQKFGIELKREIQLLGF